MTMLLDVVGSAFIGGLILLMLLSFNSAVMEGAGVQTFNTVVQSNMTSLSEIIEYDFRKMGYRVGTVYDSAIVYADSVRLMFRGDVDNDGTVDRVSYFYDPVKKAPNRNPRTRILYRQVNGGPTQAINIGLTRFRLKYYDANQAQIAANPVGAPLAIRTIRLVMDMESVSPYDTVYAGATWERSITPKNLD